MIFIEDLSRKSLFFLGAGKPYIAFPCKRSQNYRDIVPVMHMHILYEYFRKKGRYLLKLIEVINISGDVGIEVLKKRLQRLVNFPVFGIAFNRVDCNDTG